MMSDFREKADVFLKKGILMINLGGRMTGEETRRIQGNQERRKVQIINIEIEAKSTHAKIAKDDNRHTAVENTNDSISFLPPANKTEKCPLCRKQFPSESKMKHHRNLDHSHKCQHCSRAYILKPDLLHHVLKAHRKFASKDHQHAESDKNEVILPKIQDENLNPTVDKCQAQVEDVIKSPPCMSWNYH